MSKNKKQSSIHLRISEDDKTVINQKAQELGYNLSRYLIEVGKNPNVTYLREGAGILKEMVNLNAILSACSKTDYIPVTEIRTTIKKVLNKLNEAIGE